MVIDRFLPEFMELNIQCSLNTYIIFENFEACQVFRRNSLSKMISLARDLSIKIRFELFSCRFTKHLKQIMIDFARKITD